jgi:hypothetical protein
MNKENVSQVTIESKCNTLNITRTIIHKNCSSCNKDLLRNYGVKNATLVAWSKGGLVEIMILINLLKIQFMIQEGIMINKMLGFLNSTI